MEDNCGEHNEVRRCRLETGAGRASTTITEVDGVVGSNIGNSKKVISAMLDALVKYKIQFISI